YGAPGVELAGLHKEMATVTQLHFLPGQGWLLSLLDDNTLHLWEVCQKDGCSHLEETRSFGLPGRPGSDSSNCSPGITRVTVVLPTSACTVACLGTEGGAVYFLTLPTLVLLEEKTLFPDEILQSVPDDYRCGKALGPVESIQEHPQDSSRLLIGYSRGLVVLWEQSTRLVQHLFLGNQQLESLAWEQSGKSIISSHSDGGYMVWAVSSTGQKTQQPVMSTIPYGMGAKRGQLGGEGQQSWGSEGAREQFLGTGVVQLGEKEAQGRPSGSLQLPERRLQPALFQTKQFNDSVSSAVPACPLQVLVMELSDEKSEHAVSVATVDLLQDREGFTWKGHDRLAPRNGPLLFPPGFQPSVLVQCVPPAAVTAVTLHSEWNLVAFGTSHGFGLFDYYRRNPVLARCTLHPNDSLAMEGPLSRVKSLKKSLRQSFRRIRKSRVSGKKRLNTSSPSSKVQEANAQLAEQAGPPEVEMTPVQRRIEPRSADDSLSGVVRCLYFADTFLRDAAHHGPTMWAGTNSGSVFAYALEVPSQEKFSERAVEAVLGKEIQLMHRAPVVAIAVLDGRGNPLPEPYEVSRDLAKAPDMQGSHSMLISSEEQFKVFTLPKVSAKTKFKLTAHEGCRVRKVALVSLASASSEERLENCLACLTNLGDIHIFTVPGLRPQVHYGCIRKEDISGIASCVFTKHGQGFYLISPSEFERFSLSARNVTEPLCRLD
ncbi:Lethal(2) giant larvae protein 1, partial [Dryobates pubescens]